MIIKCGIPGLTAQSGNMYKSFKLISNTGGAAALVASMDQCLEAEFGKSTVYLRDYSFTQYSPDDIVLSVRATN